MNGPSIRSEDSDSRQRLILRFLTVFARSDPAAFCFLFRGYVARYSLGPRVEVGGLAIGPAFDRSSANAEKKSRLVPVVRSAAWAAIEGQGERAD